MGGPVLEFCGGRVDAQNGADNVLMGPTPEQQELFPCQVNGQCKVHLYILAVIVTEVDLRR
jgi:catalase-peroxidase